MSGKSQNISSTAQQTGNILAVRSNWHRTADLISNLTAPPILAVPTFVILGVHDQLRNNISSANLLLSLCIAVVLGVLFPIGFVLVLRSRGLVSDLHISIRQQRTIPYLAGILAYLVAFALIYSLIGVGILSAVMLCYAVNTLIVLCINFGWKVSAHATGLGGPLAALTLVFGWSVWPLYILVPVVNWARVFLKAHTLAQVIVGSGLGFGLTFLQLGLIFRPLGWI